MKIVTVIPICKDDAARAELLLDLIYQLDNRTAKGCCLLAFASEVHQEMRDKLRMAASLAFESVDVFDVPQLAPTGTGKVDFIYAMFKAVATFVGQTYRWPWLWLEPDCVPLRNGWQEKLADAYEAQPKRYLSRWLKGGEITFIHRVGIYPVGILQDMNMAVATQVPFEAYIVNKTTKSDLFQQLPVTLETDYEKIRPDAVILHHDKVGLLADWVRKSIPNPDWVNATYEIQIEPSRMINVGPPPTEPPTSTQAINLNGEQKRRPGRPRKQPQPEQV